jgi:hypothetical protein
MSSLNELQKLAQVLAKLENKVAYVTCPFDNMPYLEEFGPCGKASNCIFIEECVVIPCENHVKEYEKENWEKYAFE